MKTKREKIEFLLEHWTDFFETLHSVESHAGEQEGAVTLMPRMSRHPSVVELGLAIERTRDVMPNKTAHLMAHYKAEWRTVTEPEKRKTKKGKTETVMVRKRRRIIPSWVRRQKVDAAFTHVVGTFQGEPFIPDELVEAAA